MTKQALIKNYCSKGKYREFYQQLLDAKMKDGQQIEAFGRYLSDLCATLNGLARMEYGEPVQDNIKEHVFINALPKVISKQIKLENITGFQECFNRALEIAAAIQWDYSINKRTSNTHNGKNHTNGNRNNSHNDNKSFQGKQPQSKGKEDKVVYPPCTYCSKTNHSSDRCFNKNKKNTKSDSTTNPAHMDVDTITDQLLSIENRTDKRPHLPIAINNTVTNALIDSGSTQSFVTKEFLKRCNVEYNTIRKPIKFISASNDTIKSLGTATVSCQLVGFSSAITTQLTFNVLDQFNHDILLGTSALEGIGCTWNPASKELLLNEHSYSYYSSNSHGYLTSDDDDEDTKLSLLQINEQELTDPVLNDNELSPVHKKELSKLVEFYTSSIEQKPNYVPNYLFNNDLIKLIPPRVCRPYSTPVAMIDAAQAKIEQMIQDGFIEKVNSSVYNNPAFFKVKPSRELRLLFNAKYINQFLARRAVIIPTIDQLLYHFFFDVNDLLRPKISPAIINPPRRSQTTWMTNKLAPVLDGNRLTNAPILEKTSLQRKRMGDTGFK